MFKVGDKVTIRFSAYGKGYPTATGTIARRTWEDASYVRLDDGQEHIVAHPNLTREVCSEHGEPFDDNPGKDICKTCEDWLVTEGGG